MAQSKSAAEIAKEQAIYAAAGAGVGAVTHKTITGSRTPIAGQIGSAMGAAASNGAGMSGTLAAGTAIVTAKVAAGAAIATAAAPFVIGAAVVGGVGYGVYKLFKSDSE